MSEKNRLIETALTLHRMQQTTDQHNEQEEQQMKQLMELLSVQEIEDVIGKTNQTSMSEIAKYIQANENHPTPDSLSFDQMMCKMKSLNPVELLTIAQKAMLMRALSAQIPQSQGPFEYLFRTQSISGLNMASVRSPIAFDSPTFVNVVPAMRQAATQVADSRTAARETICTEICCGCQRPPEYRCCDRAAGCFNLVFTGSGLFCGSFCCFYSCEDCQKDECSVLSDVCCAGMCQIVLAPFVYGVCSACVVGWKMVCDCQ